MGTELFLHDFPSEVGVLSALGWYDALENIQEDLKSNVFLDLNLPFTVRNYSLHELQIAELMGFGKGKSIE